MTTVLQTCSSQLKTNLCFFHCALMFHFSMFISTGEQLECVQGLGIAARGGVGSETVIMYLYTCECVQGLGIAARGGVGSETV